MAMSAASTTLAVSALLALLSVLMSFYSLYLNHKQAKVKELSEKILNVLIQIRDKK